MQKTNSEGRTLVSNPLNLQLQINDDLVVKVNPFIEDPRSGNIPNYLSNFIILQVTLGTGKGSLADVLTVHFARFNFVDKVKLDKGDYVPIKEDFQKFFQPSDLTDGKLNCYYKELLLVTSYDNNFDDYLNDFCQITYTVFNTLVSFMVKPKDFPVIPAQKNILGFSEYVRRHDKPTSSFVSAYPLITVVQIIQDAKRRGALYTNIKEDTIS
ncbi:MAG: hypothetical protein ACI9Y7_000669 [Dokdonia sp.]|jgi:hypothetical protein